MTPGNDHRSTKEEDNGQIVGLPSSEPDSLIWQIRPRFLANSLVGPFITVIKRKRPRKTRYTLKKVNVDGGGIRGGDTVV